MWLALTGPCGLQFPATVMEQLAGLSKNPPDVAHRKHVLQVCLMFQTHSHPCWQEPGAEMATWSAKLATEEQVSWPCLVLYHLATG